MSNYWLEPRLRQLPFRFSIDNRHPGIFCYGPLAVALSAYVGAVGEAVFVRQITVDGAEDCGRRHFMEIRLHRAKLKLDIRDVLAVFEPQSLTATGFCLSAGG